MDITVYLPDELGQWAKNSNLSLSRVLRDKLEADRHRQESLSAARGETVDLLVDGGKGTYTARMHGTLIANTPAASVYLGQDELVYIYQEDQRRLHYDVGKLGLRDWLSDSPDAYFDALTALGETVVINVGVPKGASQETTDADSETLEAEDAPRPASEPIQPVPGRHLAISEIIGQAVIATRETVSGLPDPAIRIFTGDTSGRSVGDTIDTYHKVNGKPCGLWTIIATVEGGQLSSGGVPDGAGKLRVNNLG